MQLHKQHNDTLPVRDRATYIPALGLINALGCGKQEVLTRLLAGDTSGIVKKDIAGTGSVAVLGAVAAELPKIPHPFDIKYDTRSNRLLLACYEQISTEIGLEISKYGKSRIAVILGSSTSGIAEGEVAYAEFLKTGSFPPDYRYEKQEMGTPAEFLAEYLGLKNAAYTISTACSSSARVFESARNLLAADICDSVLLGGGDSLCNLTINGFSALEAVSNERCNPFSRNRKGITIGEGATLFIMNRDKAGIRLLGTGESADAHHITAPHPEGDGAAKAMRLALESAGLGPADIDYVNLHGTGTQANDAAESIAINKIFPDKVSCSSTKPLTGHMLGAAGGTEVAFCWLLLSEMNPARRLIPHVWDGERDPEIMDINLVDNQRPVVAERLEKCMSCSYAFGGNNACVILGKAEHS